MIGRFELDAPPMDDSLSQMVETHRSRTGQDYAAILFFGLWGTADCSPEVRLYAAYRHLSDNPEDGAAWLETAKAHQEAGDPARAEAILDELERLDTPNLFPNLYGEDPAVHRAYLAADTGQHDRAIDLLDALRVKHGDSPVYHHALGTVLHDKGDYAGAAGEYEQALEALEAFRAEVEAEDLLDETNVDFEAAEQCLRQAAADAAAGRPHAGRRVLDLGALCPDLDVPEAVSAHHHHHCGCGHEHCR